MNEITRYTLCQDGSLVECKTGECCYWMDIEDILNEIQTGKTSYRRELDDDYLKKVLKERDDLQSENDRLRSMLERMGRSLEKEDYWDALAEYRAWKAGQK